MLDYILWGDRKNQCRFPSTARLTKFQYSWTIFFLISILYQRIHLENTLTILDENTGMNKYKRVHKEEPRPARANWRIQY